jgi:hypothetical protein
MNQFTSVSEQPGPAEVYDFSEEMAAWDEAVDEDFESFMKG